MADLSHEDIVQQFANTTFFYKGKPHKVKRVGEDDVRILDLRTQRTKEVEFKLKDFLPVQTRLGMVNIDGVAVYVRRLIRKQYLTGINSTNTECFPLNSIVAGDRLAAQHKVREMECPEFADMLLGHYPTLESAWAQAKKIDGAVAFDKQWALDASGAVYFRTDKVGAYWESDKRIELDEPFKHYSVLLKDCHEKAVRNFR